MAVPKLRFREFTDEWELTPLSDIATFSKGALLSKSDLSPTGTDCVLYGELYTTYNEVIKEVKSKTNVDVELLKFANVNDVIIPSSGETAIDIATASCITIMNVACGGDLNMISPIKENGVFLSYQLNSSKKNSIAKIAQGASVVHIYNEGLKKIKVDLPSVIEQQKIADFLSLLDRKTALQEKKIALLKDYKRGVLQTIKNSTKKTVSLSEISDCHSSNKTISIVENAQEDKFPIYDANSIFSFIDTYDMEQGYVSIIKDGAGVGRLNLCLPQSSFIATLNAITPNNCSLEYLYFALQTINFNKYITGSTIPHIYYKDYSKEVVPYPNENLRITIAKLFEKIENKLSINSNGLALLYHMKTALLQQLFV